MLKQSKKGIILTELIFTIVIVSTIAIFSMTILYSLYEKFSSDYKKEIVKLDIISTEILLDNIFSNATKVNVNDTEINFYQIDTKLFNLDYYSRFVDLNSSDTNKNSIYSPNTIAQNLIEYSITFDEENFYEIRNDSYDELINFEDTSSKEIKEQYKIVSTDHTLICKDTNLYLDNNLLLEDISQCSFNLTSNLLTIDIKIEDTPVIWKYKL